MPQFQSLNEDIEQEDPIESEDVSNGDILDTNMQNVLMDKETLRWNQRVQIWIKDNKKAYMYFSSIQIFISMLLLGLTLIFFLKWNKQNPEHELQIPIKLVMGLLGADILTYLIDFVLVIKRWKTMLFFRNIACTLSIVQAVIVQVSFYKYTSVDKRMEVDFGSSRQRWIMLMIIYMYETYIVWAVLNTLMYF